MEPVFIVGVIVVGFIVLAIGGGIGYWIWLATRSKKMTWRAYVYQMGDGEIKYENKILNELKPYTEDIIEKIDKKDGATHYWLQKMKKAVPVVTADCVEVWGQNKKYVKVLLQEDTCTLLKSGYDHTIGAKLFRPMPHDRINMIKTELAERKERIQDKKDILSAIMPYVTIGITLVALVVAIYIIVQGAVEASKNNFEGSQEIADALSGLTGGLYNIYGIEPQNLNNTDNRDIQIGEPPAPIPP